MRAIPIVGPRGEVVYIEGEQRQPFLFLTDDLVELHELNPKKANALWCEFANLQGIPNLAAEKLVEGGSEPLLRFTLGGECCHAAPRLGRRPVQRNVFLALEDCNPKH